MNDLRHIARAFLMFGCLLAGCQVADKPEEKDLSPAKAGSEAMAPAAAPEPHSAQHPVQPAVADADSTAPLGPIVDRLVFGDAASEAEHGLQASGSELFPGALGMVARRLLPSEPVSWQGGRVSFRMKVDPRQPNYATIRLWGSDATDTRLLLYIDGLQVGYRHLGDIDILDEGNGAPSCGQRFFYTTTPLPTNRTAGRTSVVLEIRSNGRIWGYGQDFEQYQKPMTNATRGLYAFYTHTEGCFVPPGDERQGLLPADPPVRPGPGVEVLDQLKERVNREIHARLDQPGPWNQHQLWFMARAYHVSWCDAYKNAGLVEKAVATLDALHAAYRADPRLAYSDPATPNADWFGLGMAGQAITLLKDALAPYLDREMPEARGLTRRAGWTEALVACRDSHREHRRSYTNQSMINDTYGIYLANRGVAALTPSKALPEQAARRYLYESVGLEPWLGSEKDGVPEKPLGAGYFLLTGKALTKELGFVGYYGEVLDWVSAMYTATAPDPGRPGDARIRAQLVRIAKARAVFRYPDIDEDGCRAMRAETMIGWRDQGHYPGDVTYVQRNTWDAGALDCAATTMDRVLLGGIKQMFDDNQFFASVEAKLADARFRVTASLLDLPDQYERVLRGLEARARLPMSKGQPDFVWSDEENGVVALKSGEEILYASLYWRARFAVNFLARVHVIRPAYDRIAVVRQETEFEDGGMTYQRPDWINFGFANGGPAYPGEMHSAHAGETLPVARIPEGVAYKPGQENVHAGKGSFYRLRYGPYLIGMNCTRDRTFRLAVPADFPAARNLATGQAAAPGSSLDVGPMHTVVLRINSN